MAFASILHLYAFPYRPYQNSQTCGNEDSEALGRMDQSEGEYQGLNTADSHCDSIWSEGTKWSAKPQTSVSGAVLQALGFKEILQGIGKAIKWFFVLRRRQRWLYAPLVPTHSSMARYLLWAEWQGVVDFTFLVSAKLDLSCRRELCFVSESSVTVPHAARTTWNGSTPSGYPQSRNAPLSPTCYSISSACSCSYFEQILNGQQYFIPGLNPYTNTNLPATLFSIGLGHLTRWPQAQGGHRRWLREWSTLSPTECKRWKIKAKQL